MRKLFLCVLCGLCLLFPVACGRADDRFARCGGDLSADLCYTAGDTLFAAHYLRRGECVTLTFTAPEGLCGCKLMRRDGGVLLCRGELSVPVRDFAALPCALFDFAALAARQTAEGFVFSDGERTYTVHAGGGIDRITLECGGARLSADIDNICFLGGNDL